MGVEASAQMEGLAFMFILPCCYNLKVTQVLLLLRVNDPSEYGQSFVLPAGLREKVVQGVLTAAVTFIQFNGILMLTPSKMYPCGSRSANHAGAPCG